MSYGTIEFVVVADLFIYIHSHFISSFFTRRIYAPTNQRIARFLCAQTHTREFLQLKTVNYNHFLSFIEHKMVACHGRSCDTNTEKERKKRRKIDRGTDHAQIKACTRSSLDGGLLLKCVALITTIS